jgi:hypothetical protein
MNRRQFIQTTALATAATATFNLTTAKAEGITGVHWPIGVFNRPWREAGGDFDATLAGTKAAATKSPGC